MIDTPPQKFGTTDWVVLVAAMIFGAFLIPHLAGTIYLVSTATTIAGPEPIIIGVSLILLAISAVIVWLKMRKLRRTSSVHEYRITVWVLSMSAIILMTVLYLRVF